MKKFFKGSKSEITFVRKKFWNKLTEVPGKLYDDVVALYYYMLDRDVPWWKKTFVVGALVYLINPADAIPDPLLFIGFGDDAIVISALIKWLGDELEDYY